jgi:hypothetical protein
MRKRIPQVNAEIIDFAELAQAPDPAVIERFRLLVRLSKRALFDNKMQFNAFQVVREPKRLTVRLLDGPTGNPSMLVGQCCFVPAPVKKGR